MATDWTASARSLVDNLYHNGAGYAGIYVQLIDAIAALAAEAFAAGEAKHGEHHQCQRCFDAGHAAGVAEAVKLADDYVLVAERAAALAGEVTGYGVAVFSHQESEPCGACRVADAVLALRVVLEAVGR